MLREEYAARKDPSWAIILLEEVAEALYEADDQKRIAELVQVMAVCSSWIADIETRNA